MKVFDITLIQWHVSSWYFTIFSIAWGEPTISYTFYKAFTFERHFIGLEGDKNGIERIDLFWFKIYERK